MAFEEDLLRESLGLEGKDTRGERRTQKRKRVRKDDGRLKRPINSFLLFAREYRAVLLREHGKLNNQQVSKLLGVKWKSMSEEEKEPFTREAEAIHAQFMKTHPDFSWHGDRAQRRDPSSLKKRRRTSSYSPADGGLAMQDQPAHRRHQRSGSLDVGDEGRRRQQEQEEEELLEQLRELDLIYDLPSSSPSPSPDLVVPATSDSLVQPPPILHTATSAGEASRDRPCAPFPAGARLEEEMASDTGRPLDQECALWNKDSPVPAGFKLVYVPLLVPETEEPSSSTPSSLPVQPIATPEDHNFGADLIRGGGSLAEAPAAPVPIVDPFWEEVLPSDQRAPQDDDLSALFPALVSADQPPPEGPDREADLDPSGLLLSCSAANLQHCCAQLGLTLGQQEYSCLLD